MDNNKSGKNEGRTIMGILAYLGPLLVISYIVSSKDPFVKFHIKQGLILLIIDVIIWFLGPMFWSLYFIIRLLNLAVFVLVVLGIINVVQGKEKELPFIGHLAHSFNF